MLRQIRARISRLGYWQRNEAGNPAPPTLQDVFSGILNGGENRTRRRRIASFKTASKMLIFLQENDAACRENVRPYRRVFVADNELKPIGRRLKTPGKHIEQRESLRKCRKNNGRCSALHGQREAAKKQAGFSAGWRARKALAAANEFYGSGRMELTMLAAAERYLKDALQKRRNPAKLPPLKKWGDGREALRMEKGGLNTEYRLM
ncbi:MAG: hypothetical protein LBU32_30620 [Clostridiales bacterium]|nr:hypothetical protein [Clostridiales bacterium]